MFVPGDLVVPRLKKNIESLLIWGEGTGPGPNVVVGEVSHGTIMTVIRFESFRTIQNASREWRRGACLLLCPSGISGWTGSGWVKKLTT